MGSTISINNLCSNCTLWRSALRLTLFQTSLAFSNISDGREPAFPKRVKGFSFWVGYSRLIGPKCSFTYDYAVIYPAFNFVHQVVKIHLLTLFLMKFSSPAESKISLSRLESSSLPTNSNEPSALEIFTVSLLFIASSRLSI
jgi:hypothetical protein